MSNVLKFLSLNLIFFYDLQYMRLSLSLLLLEVFFFTFKLRRFSTSEHKRKRQYYNRIHLFI